MNAVQPARTPARTPITTAAQVFEAELAHQRIPPEHAVATVTFLTGRPEAHGEGFVTAEAARVLVAKALFAAKESACGNDAETLVQVANEIAPAFPYVDVSGDLVWACCVSTIGSLCNHRLTPAERQILGAKHDDAGRWVRRHRDGERVESITACQMCQFLTKGSATGLGHVSVIDSIVTVELVTELGVRKVLIYRWETLDNPGPLPPPVNGTG